MPTTQQIVETAERIHNKRGLEALSMRSVAKAVRVTPMALYRHFADKDALLNAVAERGFATLETYLAKAGAESRPIRRMRQGLIQYREFALAHRRMFELMFFLPRAGVPKAPASLGETTSPSFGKLIETLKQCMDAGSVRRSDPGLVILMLWAMAQGLIALHFSGRFGADATFREIFDLALDTELDALKPRQDPSARA